MLIGPKTNSNANLQKNKLSFIKLCYKWWLSCVKAEKLKKYVYKNGRKSILLINLRTVYTFKAKRNFKIP